MKWRIFTIAVMFFMGAFMWWPDAAYALVEADDILSVDPAAPQPNQEVTIAITDPTSIQLGSTIQWFVNDVERTSDANKLSIIITVGEVGEETVVRGVITGAGQNQTVVAVIAPVRVDLIVGANNRTPNFYQGRSLPSDSSEIAVHAHIFGGGAGPFSYYWRVNGNDYPQSAGYSSNMITFTPRLDNTMFVELSVFDQQGRTVAEDEILIPLVDPEIHFYESNPLQGLMPNALRSPHYLLYNSVTLRGEPYFYSGTPQNTKITWKIDGRAMMPDNNPFELTIEKLAESGRANVTFDILDTEHYLEDASGKLEITF